MDAIPQIGISLLVVLPGLAAYCALYGVFGSNTLVSTVPRDPKSVEALTVILLAALAAHGSAALIASLATMACGGSLCARMQPVGPEPMTALLRMATEPSPSRIDLTVVLVEVLLASVAMFFLVNFSLWQLQRHDRLPYWLYRWTATLANGADHALDANLAYVLTTVDVDKPMGAGKQTLTVLYIGLVEDLAVDETFNIARIVLVSCERHLVDLTTSFRTAIATGQSNKTNALIPRMAIEAKMIRNVSFERVSFDEPPVPDLLAAGLRRLYGPGAAP